MTPGVGEDDWVARILAALPQDERLLVPPGHDCAAVDLDGEVAVVTTDVLVDGVHFDVTRVGAEAVGAKALLVNLSDLAAAAAVPVACEVGVVLPPGRADDWLMGIARGLGRVAARYGCAVAGGDTNVADGPLTLAVTAIGRPGPGGVLTRAGARRGDVLSVTGPLGGSRAGRHLDFVPRLAEAAALARLGVPHAMMDLSDGLSRDLPRLCRCSGVGARVETGHLPIHPDVGGPPSPDEDARVRHALDDGEDFELLLAHDPLDEATAEALAALGVTLHPIGEVRPAGEGLTLAHPDGRVEELVPRGWDHFTRPDGG